MLEMGKNQLLPTGELAVELIIYKISWNNEFNLILRTMHTEESFGTIDILFGLRKHTYKVAVY